MSHDDLDDQIDNQPDHEPDHGSEDGFDDTVEDRALRDRLLRLDPAAPLPTADPAWVARLLEDAMSDDLDLDVPETRQTGVHDRSRLTWLVTAAAVLLIAGVGGFVLVDRGDDDVPSAGSSSGGSGQTGADPDGGTSPDTGDTTVLSAPAGVGNGRCAVPSADVLARQTLAFDGTVTSMSDGLVTLEPTTFYTGEPTAEVQVQAPEQVLRDLILAVSFEEGQRYLVSAVEGQVSVCGYSAPWSPELEQLYRDAFPG